MDLASARALAVVLAIALQDAAVADKAALFFLDVARPVLATRESTPATVRVRLSAALKGEVVEFESDVAAHTSPGFTRNYTLANWRIVDGGGQIVSTTGDQATFTAPAAKPAGGMVTLAVDVLPKTPGHPKATLLGRVSITDAETTFMLDVPERAINGERYILESNPPSQLDQTLSRLPPEQRRMVEAQMRAAGAAKGVDVPTMMTKGRAIYSQNDDATTVLIEFPSAGLPATTVAPPTTAIVSVTFKGRAPGTFQVMPDENNNKNMFSVTRANGDQFVSGHAQCVKGSGVTNLKLNCPNCVIAIETYGGGWVKGTVRGEVDYIAGCDIVRGRLFGRFKVPTAN